MPNPSTRFTGQRDIITRLKEHFLSDLSHGEFPQRKYFVLYGMGGIGKSQICLKFIEEMSDQ
jgi:KaiC/GvpD/RAD55 family RecA-like ATPase